MPSFAQRALDLLGVTSAAPEPAPEPAPARAPGSLRQLRLGDRVIPYTLQRARRRSIGFTVGPDGLAVRAPSWVRLAQVDAALHDKAGWIIAKLAEQQERRRRQEAARIAWGPGARLPYLGAPLTLVLAHGREARGGLLLPGMHDAQELHLALPQDAAPEQVRAAAQAWLMRAGRQRFTERLDHFAPLLQVRWTRLRLSSAATRWGSARTGGAISLNWRLMHHRPAIIDYVVVHELSHLRVMDHSPRFWSVVQSVVPDYAALRRSLRDEAVPQWD